MKHNVNDYPVTITTIQIGNREIELRIVDDPDNLLDKLSREDRGGRLYLPYWTYLWESAIGLARHVSNLGEMLNGQDILEIGCGYGLVGIVADHAGGNVVFTDFEYDALLFARHNVQHNNIASATFIQMDWNRTCFECQFDVILASDVIYEEQNWQPILALLKRLLAPNGVAIFSEPNRKNTDGFIKSLRRNGFTFDKATCKISTGNKKTHLNLYTIRWDYLESSSSACLGG